MTPKYQTDLNLGSDMIKDLIFEVINEEQLDEKLIVYNNRKPYGQIVFLAGGAGSGKSYVARRTTGGLGMKMVNSDDMFEKMLNDAGMETTPKDIYSDEGQEIRGRAKAITARQKANYIEGRLGLIIDGTAKDYNKISGQVASLRKLGYECSMIFVNTSLDTALSQNRKRKRTLPDDEVEMMWNQVQNNMGKFQSLFGGSSFIIVDNNMAGEDVFAKVWKRVAMMIRKKVNNPIAKRWITMALKAKDRTR